MKPRGDLTKLLDDDPVAAYWVGFLMADGSFVKDRLKLSLATKDADHVAKFAAWLGDGIVLKQGRASVGCSLMSKATMPLVRERFDIRERKTYDPPLKLPYECEMLWSWLVGYVDGDGSVKKPDKHHRLPRIFTVAHSSWFGFLSDISSTLSWGHPYKSGEYVGLVSNDWADVLHLKTKINVLPVLRRKWDIIDETLTARVMTGPRVREMLLAGYSTCEITAETGSPKAVISGQRRKLGLPDQRYKKVV